MSSNKHKADSNQNYLGPNGNIYNSKYEDGIRDDDGIISMLKELEFPSSSNASIKFYEDYENELLVWGDKVTKIVGDVNLPNTVGRFFFRPNILPEISEDEVNSRQSTFRRDGSDTNLTTLKKNTISLTSSKSDISEERSDNERDASSDNSLQQNDKIKLKFTNNSNMNHLDVVTKSLTTHSVTTGKPIISIQSLSYSLPTIATRGDQLSARSGGGGDLSARGDMATDRNYDGPINWESILIPPEPDPNNYTSYEDFVDALVKWASKVKSIEQSKMLPVHVSQLPDYIPIKVVNSTESNHRHVCLEPPEAVLSTPKQFSFSPLLIPVPFFEGLRNLPTRKSDSTSTSSLSSSSSSSYNTSRPRIDYSDMKLLNIIFKNWTKKKFGSLMDKQQQQVSFDLSSSSGKRKAENNNKIVQQEVKDADILQTATTSYYYDCYGTSHRVLVLNPDANHFYESEEKFDTSQCLLRNIDLPHGDVASNNTNTSPVPSNAKFVVPSHDISRCTPKYFESTPEEIKNLRNLRFDYEKLVNKYNLHDCFAWFNPTKIHESHKRSQLSLLKSVDALDNSVDKMNQLIKFIKNPIWVDLFYDYFTSSTKNLEFLYNSINMKNLSQLLDVFFETKNKKVHANLCLILKHAGIQNESLSSEFIESIVSSGTKYLSLLPYIVSYFRKIPLDILPYSQYNIDLVKQSLKYKFSDNQKKISSILKLIDLVFDWYYLHNAHNELNLLFNQSPEYYERTTQNIKVYLTNVRSTLQKFILERVNEVTTLFNNNKNILQDVIPFVSHRSSAVSSVFVFLIIQFLRHSGNNQNSLPNPLETDFTSILNSLMEVNTKLSHAKIGVHRILESIKSHDTLRYFLIGNNRLYQILDNKKYHIFSNVATNLVASDLTLYTDMSNVEWDNFSKNLDVTKPTINCWLNDNLFHKVLDSLSNCVEEHNYNKIKFLVTVSKALYSVEKHLIEDAKKQKSKQSVKIPIAITPNDIQHIVDFIHNTTGSNAYVVTSAQCDMIKVFRNLSRTKSVWTFLKDDDSYHEMLVKFCRSNKPAVNRQAWKALSCIAKAHKGALSSWTSNKNIMKNYFNLFNIGEGVLIVQHSLECFTSFFNKSGWKLGKDKNIESEMKSFSNYLINQNILHVNFHNIFKNLTQRAPGAAFHVCSRRTYLPFPLDRYDCNCNNCLTGDGEFLLYIVGQ
eukprot:TRINITY_DN408_c3_g1_i3.p1 TRINITY_DN408_c3_g1~~TRINITY_DN408_c3_g1_i3.p1  ORF type:complete len:1188 (-),score=277.46 TRINITY_DN408_c3_g1_i3:150-3713(-)